MDELDTPILAGRLVDGGLFERKSTRWAVFTAVSRFLGKHPTNRIKMGELFNKCVAVVIGSRKHS